MNSFPVGERLYVLMDETSNTLQLTDVAAAFAGLYQCTVTNAAGSSNDSTLLYVAPNIIAGPENMTTNVSMSVTFSCMAEGFPVPDIVWEYEGNSERDGSSFPGSSSASSESGGGSTSGEMSGSPSDSTSSSQTYMSSDGQIIIVNTTVEGTAVNSTLTIDSVQYDYFGVYHCVANSSLLDRLTSAEATLSVSPEGSVAITPPGVNATMRGSNHTLTCSAEGGPGNEVSWVKLGTETENSDGPELVIPITNASVGGVYQCTVENLAGSDSATAVVNVPIGSPEIIAARALSPTEIMVMWLEVPPAERNGVISMYAVRYVPLETCSGTVTESITNTSMTSTILTGLEEYVEYDISVRAFTSVGPGPYSDSVVERTDEDAPDMKLNATAMALSETEIAVSWVELSDICQKWQRYGIRDPI
ncbi:Protogenin [Geodia barretti]|nr:Protogenin [Geodia barretti]